MDPRRRAVGERRGLEQPLLAPPVTVAADGDDVDGVKQPIEDHGHHHSVAEHGPYSPTARLLVTSMAAAHIRSAAAATRAASSGAGIVGAVAGDRKPTTPSKWCGSMRCSNRPVHLPARQTSFPDARCGTRGHTAGANSRTWRPTDTPRRSRRVVSGCTTCSAASPRCSMSSPTTCIAERSCPRRLPIAVAAPSRSPSERWHQGFASAKTLGGRAQPCPAPPVRSPGPKIWSGHCRWRRPGCSSPMPNY